MIEKIGIHLVTSKSGISIAELQNLNRNDISPIDRWALNFDPTKRDYYERLSSQLAVIGVLLPVLTVLDHNIRRDWLDVLLIYLETQAITNNLYLLSPIGPTFQNRFRPVVYYDAVPNEERSRPFNRSSLYSGHTASIAETSFLTAKVYCDYHPELGWNKYLVYVAAAIPPLLMAYFRLKALRHFTTDVMTGFGVGALCGILIPELHRIQDKNFSVGFYSSSEATGLAVKWQPNFLK
ncbi:MAG: phosphatase PAP2 family protein [Ignavibacteriales bacterium]|nr:phosphatase PAP2 family protein [Ignavibacteriales bacterium]